MAKKQGFYEWLRAGLIDAGMKDLAPTGNKNDPQLMEAIKKMQVALGQEPTGLANAKFVQTMQKFMPTKLSPTGSTASPMQDGQTVSGRMQLTPPMPNMRPGDMGAQSLQHPISTPMPGMTAVARSVGQPGGYQPDMSATGYNGGPPSAMPQMTPQARALMATMPQSGQDAVMRGQQQMADRTQAGRDALAAAMAQRDMGPRGPWARPLLNQPPPPPMQASMMPSQGGLLPPMAPPQGGPPTPPQGATAGPPMGPPPPRPMPDFSSAGPPPPPQDQSQMVGLPGGQAYPSVGAMAQDKLGQLQQLVMAMIYGPQGPPPGAPPPSPDQINMAKQKLTQLLMAQQKQPPAQGMMPAMSGQAGY